MRIKLAAAVFAAVISIAPAVTLAHGVKHHEHQYYVALGDSLARGGQPNAQGQTGPTNKGYTNDLYAAEKPKFKALKLIELGCPGETTTTMIKGGTCKYAAGSQLGAAVQFLHAHKGHIAFITLDIGADDTGPCFFPTKIDHACFKSADARVKANLPKIARQLRKAAGQNVPILAMTYYDPYLASWFAGQAGRQTASESQTLVKKVNKQISSDFRAKRFEIAPVADAFDTYESLRKTKLYRGKQVPVPVVLICKKTWMCAPPPTGPDVHANASGYRKIAKVFEKEGL